MEHQQKRKTPLNAQQIFEMLGLPQRKNAKTCMEHDVVTNCGTASKSQEERKQKIDCKLEDVAKISTEKSKVDAESDACIESSSVTNPFTDTSSEYERSHSSNDPSYNPLADTDIEREMSVSEDETMGGTESISRGNVKIEVKGSRDKLEEEICHDEETESSQKTRSTRSCLGTLAEDNPVCDQHPVSNVNEIVEDSCDSIISETYPNLSQSCFNNISKPKLVVAKRGESNKKWDKKHSCKFCKKQVIKMSTHLRRVHKEEQEVNHALRMKKGSTDRRKAWGKLLNEGDYEHNFAVLKEGSGMLIPKYRSNKREIEDFVTCPCCKGMFFKSRLAHHVANCKENPGSGNVQKRGQSVKEGNLLMPVPQTFSDGFYRNILQNMRKDDIFRLIKNDHLLVCFGEWLYYRKDVEEHIPGYISGRLRELGRLLKCLRQKSGMKISTMTQALHVSNFDLLIQCVRELADFDESCNQFRKGTLALKIGYSLKKCASVIKAEAIKREDIELKQQAQSFEDLVRGNWYDLVNATATQSIYRARQNKPRLLPACKDVEKIHQLLNKKCQSKDYATLAKATLCLISLFNHKRGGEVQRIKITEFERGMLCGTSSNQDILQSLSESEKKLLNYFKRIEIRDEFNRIVPVLLTSEMVESVKRLIEMHYHLEPPIDSPYLFITQTGVRPYRRSDVIREFAKESGVNDLTIFTFTHLREQIATLFQTMEITKWEQDQLAKFLCLDIRIHRNVYRQQSEVLDRAKVAKILLNVNKGMNVSILEDIKVDDNEELEDRNANAADDERVSDSDADEEIVSVPNKKGEEDVHESSEETVVSKRQGRSLLRRKTGHRKNIWTEDEKQAVKKELNACIAMNRIPKKHEAERAIANQPVLKNRTWRNVKYCIYNIVKKNKL